MGTRAELARRDPFIGGAFGSSLRVWPHTYVATVAAKVVGRPVKLVLSRREYYGGTGARPWTQQRVQIGADRDGTLPMAPVHGGSLTMSSVGPAMRDACEKLRGAVYGVAGVNTGHVGKIARRLGRDFEAEGAFDPGDLEKRFSMEGLAPSSRRSRSTRTPARCGCGGSPAPTASGAW